MINLLLVSLNQCEAVSHSHLSVICSVKERCLFRLSTLKSALRLFRFVRLISEEGELYAPPELLSTFKLNYFYYFCQQTVLKKYFLCRSLGSWVF